MIRSPLLLFVAILLVPAPVRAQDGEVLDQIAAVVGDQILLRSEVDGIVAGAVRQQGMTYSPELWEAALQQMVDEKVLQIHARRDTNIVTTDEQVSQMLDDRIDQMAAQLGGRTRLEAAYGQTIVEIKAELREDFRNQILGDQLRRQKLLSISITPSEVEQWFRRFPTDSLPTLPEMVRVAHIVRYPRVTDDARREAREILEAIRDSLIAGASSFEEMAELFSDDPGSASAGGRYEEMAVSEVVPEFAAVATRADIGAISQIFETEFGLHILRLNARRGDIIDYNHILIRFDESKSDPGPAIDHLAAVRDSVLANQIPFDLAARRNSEERSSALRGGRVIDPQSGERNLILQALGPFWQETIAGLEEGEISEPTEIELVDGRRAYHIVLLQDRIPPHQVDISTDYSMIQQYAKRDKEARVMQEWLAELRDDVYIDIRTTGPARRPQ